MKVSVGKRIGEYIKYQREKRQITIAQLAKDTNLTSSYISRLEQGDYDSPSIDAAQQLAEGLRMPFWAFLQKSGVADIALNLPDLASYFHEKYQYPPEAITDIELFIKYIEERYAKSIARYRKVHQKYWQNHDTAKAE